MFSLPPPTSPSSSGSDQIPSDDIVVTEDGETLDLVLRFCYPVDEPPIDDLVLGIYALAATAKYELISAEARLRRLVHAQIEKDRYPLFIFNQCCEFRLEDEARLAARRFLDYPPPGTEPPAMLNHITALGYHYLLRYHGQCTTQVTSLLNESAPWLQPINQAKCQTLCGNCGSTSSALVQRYLSVVRSRLTIAPGRSDFARLYEAFASVEADLPMCHREFKAAGYSRTGVCGDKGSIFCPLIRTLAREMKRLIDEVELVLDI
ncbi:hypothetical protein HGRIS_014761 [Hohenbuehelia grisea]|uniref:Uncharacterized protein n=1 Tax=Hohenbuehelia grisea TaxID=104357 RepID=A0ABR3IQN3_9AGAR